MGARELAFSGRLPLEQGAAFEQAIWNIAKTQRAIDKQTGTILDWQQSTADALLTLTRQHRTRPIPLTDHDDLAHHRPLTPARIACRRPNGGGRRPTTVRDDAAVVDRRQDVRALAPR